MFEQTFFSPTAEDSRSESQVASKTRPSSAAHESHGRTMDGMIKFRQSPSIRTDRLGQADDGRIDVIVRGCINRGVFIASSYKGRRRNSKTRCFSLLLMVVNDAKIQGKPARSVSQHEQRGISSEIKKQPR